MDRRHIVYLLIVLLILLFSAIYAYFVVQSKKRTRQRQQRDENRADRERMAAKRIAENDGQPLSARFATSPTDRREAERSV
jgi:flagellar basal body-associated protein FliL